MSSEGLTPWLLDGHLLPGSPHGLPSVWVCVLSSSSYKDTVHTELEPTLLISFNLHFFFDSSISRYGHVLRCWRTLTYEWRWGVGGYNSSYGHNSSHKLIHMVASGFQGHQGKSPIQVLCKPRLVLYLLKFYWSKVVSRLESVL